MNQKGFTLFTALVAFLLISLSLLLITSMVSTERNSYEILASISEQEEMQAMADLARADALQVFNYGIRYTIEDYSKKDENPRDSRPDNRYVVFPADASDWGNMQQKFIADRFGIGSIEKNQFALLAARHLISLLLRVEDARGFRIELVNPNESVMAKILESVLERQALSYDFFDVIECPNGTYSTCTGTFYVTLDMSRGSIDDDDYEQFPQVRVENSLTQRVLKEPILPRGKFRIYVPVRLFKALAGARTLAFDGGTNGAFDTTFINDVRAYAGAYTAGETSTYIKGRIETLANSKGLMADSDGFSLKEVRANAIINADAILTSYEVDLYFEETNPQYRVSEVNDNIYGITLKVYT